MDATGDSGGRRHWGRTACYWPRIGPPLRPCEEDLAFVRDAVREWDGKGTAPRVLVLGVTPEFWSFPWPQGTDILAVDRSEPMIRAAWPGPRHCVLCADWLEMALPDASRDIALCDGGLHLLAYPQEQGQLIRRLRGVLSDNGLCILRLYVPPPRRESSRTVLEDLLAGRVANLNVLKLRLSMALQKSAEEGVALTSVWAAVRQVVPDLAALAAAIGWPAGQAEAFEVYRDSPARYHFVTIEQVRGLFCCEPGGFDLPCVREPSCELGGRYPTAVLQRRPRAVSDRDSPRRKP